jgi:hypothetical protein
MTSSPTQHRRGVDIDLDIDLPIHQAGAWTPLDDMADVPEKPPAAAPIAARPRRPAISGGGATGLHPSLQWAVEIEQSLVALLWQCPEQIGVVRHELDERIHITQPRIRHVLDAIEWAYRGMGCVSWAMVVGELCHVPGAFQECGGKAGLNEIFTDGDHLVLGTRDPEPFIAYYIDFLKKAAVVRGVDPSAPVLDHTTGYGFLRRNKAATTSKHPFAKGNIPRCCCGRRCAVAAWLDDDDGLALKLTFERSS